MVYKENETMRIIGRHTVADEYLSVGGIAAEDFCNVLNAHKANWNGSLFEIGMDAFTLGYIYGKRAERARRKQDKRGHREDMREQIANKIYAIDDVWILREICKFIDNITR